MKNIEIEIRIFLENDELFRTWLEKNAEHIGTKSQDDIYFQPKKNPFIIENDKGEKDADKWLRIRTTEKGSEICYKHWHRDPKTKASLYADEFETSIADFEKVVKIFEHLGFDLISQIKKSRDSWVFDHFKIEKDNVEGLGNFYEIEFSGEIDEPEKGNEIILDFLKNVVGLNKWKIIDRGYPWMQWNDTWK